MLTVWANIEVFIKPLIDLDVLALQISKLLPKSIQLDNGFVVFKRSNFLDRKQTCLFYTFLESYPIFGPRWKKLYSMKCRNQNLTEFGDAIDVQLLRNTLNRFGQYTEASEVNSMVSQTDSLRSLDRVLHNNVGPLLDIWLASLPHLQLHPP